MNRKGFIKISNDLYVSEWHRFFIFMQDFRPTHIEHRHWDNGLWYFYGVSDKFDEVEEGENIPEYSVIFTTNENKELSYEFKKIHQQPVDIRSKILKKHEDENEMHFHNCDREFIMEAMEEYYLLKTTETIKANKVL